MLRSQLNLGVTPDGVVNRRGFLRSIGATGMAAGAMSLGWRDFLMANAPELRRQGKSMILLWMDGGPSQFETFNPKPGSVNQGPTRTIQTKLPGIHFAEGWSKTAAVLDRIALIRSMESREAEHDRAIHIVRTGYPVSPAIRYPAWGSVVSSQRMNPDFELPAFVRVGSPRIATRDIDHGVLGVRHAYFHVPKPGEMPPDVTPTVAPDRLQRRLELASRFDTEFARHGGALAVEERRTVYDRTGRFVLSPRMGVFDLGRESNRLRDAYGRTNFGQGCLLARRLVEEGVSFVEVISTGDRNDAGWDTHGSGFRDQPNLNNEVDPAYSTLLLDLEARGMLENTLVVWMGEFGRTPRIKADGGRDHYSQGWLAALAGGGVRGGQVIGATDANGVRVTERPVAIQDLFVSFCHVLGFDPITEYSTADERPVKLVEGGQLVRELFS